MIDFIIRWSVKNRFAMILLALLLTGWGINSLMRTPLDAIPDISDVQVIIKTTYAGQAPQVVEDQVTYPLTTAMLAVPGAVTVRGFSFFNDSFVYVIFEEGTDLYWARSRVLEYLSQVVPNLPDGARPALGPDATGVGWVYQYALIDRSGTHDLAALTSLQNWFLKFELQMVEGVAEVASIGGMVREYQVVVEPDRLRAHQIPLSRVISAIRRGNQETGGRVIEMAEADYMIRASGYIDDLDDLRAIPLGVDAMDTPITLADVAEIRFGPDLRRGIGELNGQGEAVGGVVIMRFGENALATIDRVKERIKALEAGLPEGVEIVETYDRSDLIDRAVKTLGTTLTEELIIVALICALFLFHPGSSLVIIISLPLGVLTAFILMHIQGINANIMSLGGIAIAIGAMVDGAIVMIENYHKHLDRAQKGDPRWPIVAHAAAEVGPSIFFSLLIIALSFAPIFALEAQEGRLFHPLAFTKTYAMAAAAGIAITILPVLMGLLVRRPYGKKRDNPVSRAVIAGYRPLLHFVLHHRKATLALCFLALISILIPFTRIGNEFMPALDEGDLLYMPSAFPAVSAGKMAQIVQQTDKLIKSLPEVASVYGKAGRATSATDPAPLSMMETTIRLKPRSEWRPGLSMKDLIAELDARVQIPGLVNVWTMPIKNRTDMLATGIKTPVGIKISGPDLSVIADLGQRIETVIAPLPGVASVFADRVVGGRYVDMSIDRQAAARHGLNIADIHDIVRSAIGGMTIGESIEGRERYPINIRYPQSLRDQIDHLRLLPILTADGADIPLSAVADLQITDGPGMIRSENARLNGWVTIDIADYDLGQFVDEAKKAVAQKIDLPAGYALKWSGQYEYMERAQKRLLTIIPLVLAIIAFLLYLNFRAFSAVVMIMGTLPLALVGGYWLMYGLGYKMSVASAAGFIALAGVAVEIGVLMIVYLDQSVARKKLEMSESGKIFGPNDLLAAVSDGALQRIRPIVMTVASTMIGLFPVMLGDGTGSEVMRRIAAPMIGGLGSALLLTTLLLPVVYYEWKKYLMERTN
ncbi:cation transporter [Iodidimonas nitroreducens]|uniref:Cation transporter n=1 Tax=Iodidimonas nitroreducens TaxID=1236968 RepID=A0A5A7N5D3_9PROT|nr:CusA/CzcA family heavy metal efflux RND transporter [Iodidimonas nitroreducens]GAK33006.1 cation efflux system protein CusA [alpha proteobacterium Q-1]GER03491.1 cation transporter [Iodidimonas nitroreducens]